MSQPDLDGKAQIRRLGVRAFRVNLADVLRQVRQGTTFHITSRDEVVAEIHPPSAVLSPRRELGALRGRIRMAEDFDLLPPDILAVMEGEEE